MCVWGGGGGGVGGGGGGGGLGSLQICTLLWVNSKINYWYTCSEIKFILIHTIAVIYQVKEYFRLC